MSSLTSKSGQFSPVNSKSTFFNEIEVTEIAGLSLELKSENNDFDINVKRRLSAPNSNSIKNNGNKSEEYRRSKSVTFADGVGLDLKSVHLIPKDQAKNILFPLYLAFMVAISKKNAKTDVYPAIGDPLDTGMTSHDRGGVEIFHEWLIAPNTSEVKRIIELLSALLPRSQRSFINFTSQSELNDYVKKRSQTENCVGIVFKFDSNNVSYSIHMNQDYLPSVYSLFGDKANCRPPLNNCPSLHYVESGFTIIQTAVDTVLMQIYAENMQLIVPKAHLFLYPKEEYKKTHNISSYYAPLCLTFGFLILISTFTSYVVMEKEKKIKEAMLMMGLRVSAYWLSWIAIYFLKSFITVTLICAIFYLLNAFESGNILIIFILSLLYAYSLILMGMMLSPFFRKEKVASSVVSLLTCVFGILPVLIVSIQKHIPNFVFWLLSLLSPTAFSFGIRALISTEISFEDDFKPIICPYSAMVLLTFDIILYFFLAIYFDHVVPGEFGPRYSPFFCFNRSYWIKETKKDLLIDCENNYLSDNADVEKIGEEWESKKAINIVKITKEFKEKDKEVIAVDDFNLDIYEGQITAILGHNGAGKSTLINMITGTLPPTKGNVKLYNLNISKPAEVLRCREMLGVCLQQDILFDDLNAIEHLSFFAELKGLKLNVNEKIEELLSAVGLSEDATTPCKNLSGGQKRKLCVCIALIGDPKIIILDEPSSGVDAYSRRNLWNLLRNYRENRVIILTTHFMDEADILADRKVIMVNGRLRCAGTSLFLKNRFGVGYHLKIVVTANEHKNFINELVFSEITNSKPEKSSPVEVSYMLPHAEVSKFHSLFTKIESFMNSAEAKVRSYGISMTTLEEVFLKLGEETRHEASSPQASSEFSSLSNIEMVIKPSFFITFTTLLKTRFILMIKQPASIVPIIILPITIILLSYFLTKNVGQNGTKSKSLKLSMDLYSSFERNFIYNSSEKLESFENSLQNLNVNPLHVDNYLNFEILRKSYIAADINNYLPDSTKWNWYFNSSMLHALPIVQNLLTNVFWLSFFNKSLSISTYSEPFASSKVQFDPNIYTFIIFSSIVLPMVPALLATEVVEDRESKIKGFLRVCGVSTFCYWFTVLTTHSIIFLIIIILMLASQAFLLKLPFLQDFTAFTAALIVFLLFIPASFLCSYVLLHMFNKTETARSSFTSISYIPAFIFSFVSLITFSNSSLSGTLHVIFCFLWPFYIPQGTFSWIFYIYLMKIQSGKDVSYFALDGKIMISYYALVFHIIFYGVLLPIVDQLKSGRSINEILKLHSGPINMPNQSMPLREDSDVVEERNRVKNYVTTKNMEKQPVLVLEELRKEFSRDYLKFWKKDKQSSKTAIENLSVMIEPQEVFGLLGPNGAGKTTAIKIMIAEESQTAGNVIICGKDIEASSEIFHFIGYCPQHDTLWKNLTLKTHLHVFALFKGVPKDKVNIVAESIMKILFIEEFANVAVKNLSGGTKRKLCYAISTLGNPLLQLLDEPSTGMDPQSKRYLWQTILSSSLVDRQDKSILLTTHSMEEADALCTRLGIMVKGVLRCLGSLQHLKDKYGGGYQVEIKWKSSVANFDGIQELVKDIFPAAEMKEHFGNRVSYSVPQNSLKSIANVFKRLQDVSTKYFEEYSFSQTTIEQVFISFAKEQEDE
ncbi:hypothetical protein B4U79_09945 [Dinothrombium tinctorium]|uniref:ABC transporter domain-containing protein n=1 Tax=Dinothrombium tinctorium TaxID=1965070 RepID=A0A3S3Q1W2_9ACAR|nr:hypothetical protein B4U79_09945 [Dinothrombium tinctorium]